MKKTLLIFFLLLSYTSFGQVDTIIDIGFYKSYFDYENLQPLFVSYKLYKGGGDCSRSKFRFKNDTKIKMAGFSDYDKSGLDMGHLVNAEDFANNCELDEKTFRFYNCLPQYPNLNRGCWKKWESKVRDLSQKDSLLIMTGGVFSNKKMKSTSSAGLPDYCWKLVYSLTEKKIIWIVWFDNAPKAKEKEITISQLLERLNYKIPIQL